MSNYIVRAWFDNERSAPFVFDNFNEAMPFGWLLSERGSLQKVTVSSDFSFKLQGREVVVGQVWILKE